MLNSELLLLALFCFPSSMHNREMTTTDTNIIKAVNRVCVCVGVNGSEIKLSFSFIADWVYCNCIA